LLKTHAELFNIKEVISQSPIWRERLGKSELSNFTNADGCKPVSMVEILPWEFLKFHG